MRLPCILLTVLPSLAMAQDAITPDEITLSPVMQVMVGNGLDWAAADIGRLLDPFMGPGGVDVDGFETAIQLQIARQRTEKVAAFMMADLNWDAFVTRDELVIYHADNDPSFIDGYLREVDLDGDGQIALAEIRLTAQLGIPDSAGLNDGRLVEVLTWDLDRDGFLTKNEVLTVLAAKAP